MGFFIYLILWLLAFFAVVAMLAGGPIGWALLLVFGPACVAILWSSPGEKRSK